MACWVSFHKNQSLERPGIDSIFLYSVPDGYTINTEHPGRPGLISTAFYEGIDKGLFFA